jgi:transposase-like protein
VNDARRPRLTVEQRREVVKALREDGHSYRAIAGALRVGQGTVSQDIRELRDTAQLEDEPERTTGLDGKERPASRPQKRAIAEAVGAHHKTVQRDLRDEGGACAPPEDPELDRVTGLDGKSYPASAQTRKQKPASDWESCTTLHRASSPYMPPDDRWRRTRRQIAFVAPGSPAVLLTPNQEVLAVSMREGRGQVKFPTHDLERLGPVETGLFASEYFDL